MPDKFLLMMASSEDSIMAAKCARESGWGNPERFPESVIGVFPEVVHYIITSMEKSTGLRIRIGLFVKAKVFQ